jgi:hypothetical protein
MADMRKYASGLMRPEDLQGGTKTEMITNVTINNKLNAPILTFDSGNEMVAWNSICRVLVNAYGKEDSDWIGHTIELSIGSYVNKDGESKQNIVVKPISQREEKKEIERKEPDPFDDEIPF